MNSYIKLKKPIPNIPLFLKEKFNHSESSYDKEEIEKFESLREYIKSRDKYPVKEKDVENFIQNNDLNGMNLDILSDVEIYWLSDKCLYRYLRACKWVLNDAKKRLVSTIVWRREFGIVKLKEEVNSNNNNSNKSKYLGFDDIYVENETGKQVVLGYDNDLRPILYLRPGRQNTDASQMHLKHSVFMLERCIDLMDEEMQDKITIFMDFKKKYDDLANLPNTKTSIRNNIKIINILETHYPERLGKVQIFNLHWAAKGIINMVLPFMDPVTKAKINYDVDDVGKYVQKEQLVKEYGGNIMFNYDHGEYWPALQQIVLDKRSERYRDITI